MAADAPHSSSRRLFLAHALTAAGVSRLAIEPVYAATGPRVANVTGLYTVEVARVEVPLDTASVSRLVREWPGQIAIGGGRFSMGGQIAVAQGLHLDMRQMKRIVWLRPAERLVRVQAGMTWRDLQDHLDPLGLAVKTMQSFASFSIGGSVSVNVHGRYVGHGPVGNTVRALQIVLADGSVHECSRELLPELFGAVIGGYGACGVITELELELAENVRMASAIEEMALTDYFSRFYRDIYADRSVVLHNADLMPPNFDRPVSVTWRRVANDRPLTEPLPLVPRGQSYTLEKNLIWAASEVPGVKRLRKKLANSEFTYRPAVKWLNHEASLDVAQLEPRTRAVSTYVLQEYFIPPRNAEAFVTGMAKILRSNRVEALNVSIRHSPPDKLSALPWAKEEVFAFVLYFKQRTWPLAREQVGEWTRALIDLALKFGGRYYLPYQLHATKVQFEQSYPEVAVFRELKLRYDPADKFSNELWRKYL